MQTGDLRNSRDSSVAQAVVLSIIFGSAHLVATFLLWTWWDSPGPEPTWLPPIYNILAFPILLFGGSINGANWPLITAGGRTFDLFLWLFPANSLLWAAASFLGIRVVMGRMGRRS